MTVGSSRLLLDRARYGHDADAYRPSLVSRMIAVLTYNIHLPPEAACLDELDAKGWLSSSPALAELLLFSRARYGDN